MGMTAVGLDIQHVVDEVDARGDQAKCDEGEEGGNQTIKGHPRMRCQQRHEKQRVLQPLMRTCRPHVRASLPGCAQKDPVHGLTLIDLPLSPPEGGLQRHRCSLAGVPCLRESTYRVQVLPSRENVADMSLRPAYSLAPGSRPTFPVLGDGQRKVEISGRRLRPVTGPAPARRSDEVAVDPPVKVELRPSPATAEGTMADPGWQLQHRDM